MHIGADSWGNDSEVGKTRASLLSSAWKICSPWQGGTGIRAATMHVIFLGCRRLAPLYRETGIMPASVLLGHLFTMRSAAPRRMCLQIFSSCVDLCLRYADRTEHVQTTIYLHSTGLQRVVLQALPSTTVQPTDPFAVARTIWPHAAALIVASTPFVPPYRASLRMKPLGRAGF
ncbi:hypothetical protein EXIGLDRAFT_65497 [Exidia glandulosa HHB12029]|uniref:Uncharacterized protein n=1 Tax=Exidia glandulosa HHB12029 TaxID=1314781 RepID=A0A165P2I4_EXIGL|nr:hypothetical protein EXIGLDRAFT_65497 [Exidia glandulosa HHB12029]